jgi:hypothetical protein
MRAESTAGAAHRAAARLLELDTRLVVGAAIVLQWILTLGIALDVRHRGWIYYQGGDQLWYYTGGWLLAHGVMPQPLVSYLWTTVMTPLALVAGPNLVDAYPAIVLLDVVVLLPVALLAFYGLARLVGGRGFAYWALVVWLVVPLIGIKYTDAGYHQRFTELILPQAFGLTAMADFPTLVAAVVSAYFCARVLFAVRPDVVDAAAAGAAAGVAIAVKPSTALFLAGPLLAFAVARAFRPAGVFLLALAPALVALAVWKWRGYGYLPLIHGSAAGSVRLAAGATSVVALHVPHYFGFDWKHFEQNLDQLREHFWSARLIEWLIVAGLVALARRSWRAFALAGGWFGAFAFVKGGYGQAGIEDSSLLRIMIPTIPAFVLMLAALPYLLPGAVRRPAPDAPERRFLSRRARWIAVGATIVLSAVVPLAAFGAARTLSGSPPRAIIVQQPIIPNGIELGTSATSRGRRVVLTWRRQTSAGGPLFYHVFRTAASASAFSCDATTHAERCVLANTTDLGATTAETFADHPPHGSWDYRVGVSANWLDDLTQGDVYLLGRPVRVTVR